MGEILMKGSLVTFVEVIGLAATGLEAEWGGRLPGGLLDSSFQYSNPAFNCACYSLV